MSVTAAKGFRAAGVKAGIKQSGAHDVCVVVNDGPDYNAACVFTSNRVNAAPVKWSQSVIADGSARAVVINSGGANACTGPAGFEDTRQTAVKVADLLSVADNDVVVCSTGLIGERLPMDKLLAGTESAVGELATGEQAGADAALAIMTTDTHPKVAVSGEDYTIGGMAKGAGMLAPGLATMLVIITTDAHFSSGELDAALRAATRKTFDRLDSDGCMSTNDTVLLMASGASGVSAQLPQFTERLTAVCHDLAMQLMNDAEGASKDIAISVLNAATEDEAVTVGRVVSRSNLLKCAIHGNDPNWGRVLSAIGTTDASFDPDQLDVAINDVWVCRNGSNGEDRNKVDMSGRLVDITIDLKAGSEKATVWTNDLTSDYVYENSAYSS